MSNPNDLLDTREAAVYLGGYAEFTVRLWRTRGTGPVYIKTNGGRVRYRRSDLDQFLEDGKRTKTNGARLGRNFRIPADTQHAADAQRNKSELASA